MHKKNCDIDEKYLDLKLLCKIFWRASNLTIFNFLYFIAVQTTDLSKNVCFDS